MRRRNQPELMDASEVPEAELAVDLRNLAWINRLLGGIAVVRALRELARVTRRRLIVNDLRRSRVAYVLIWLITRFSRNRLTRYDSPVSVERAFTPDELGALACDAGLDQSGRLSISRHLYYRMALVYDRDPQRRL